VGYFRFILASLVALSHTIVLPLNLGISAVVGFYFLSGYLMTESFAKFRITHENPIRAFYLDRFFRIFPIFWVMFALSALLLYQRHALNIDYKFFLESAIIPNNYFFTFKLLSDQVIEPSWSLGAEIQFYILIPLILLLSKKTQSIIAMIFLAGQIFALAMPNNIGYMFSSCSNYPWLICDGKVSDLFGYRYLSFALGIFLMGSICRHWHMGYKFGKSLVLSIFSMQLIFLFFILPINGLINNVHTFPVSIGFLITIPACLVFLHFLKAGFSFGRLDFYLGKLAYPLFLSHMPAIAVVKYYLGDHNVNIFYAPECLLCAIAISLLLYFIQGYIDLLRYKIRGFGRITGQ